MKILIDMNLSRHWIGTFQSEGWTAVLWSSIGAPNAPDTEIMDWAKTNNYIVFTHDLDFGALLASSKADRPSVFQVRMQETLPIIIGAFVVQNMRRFEQELMNGAIVTVNETRGKVRILPI